MLRTIHEAVLAAAARTPDLPAIAASTRDPLTYDQLDRAAHALAVQLRRQVPPASRIAVAEAKTPERVISPVIERGGM